MGRPNPLYQVGKIHDTNYGKLMITRYGSAKDVGVRFLTTGYETTAHVGSIKTGSVRDFYLPTVAGIGYVGVGEYNSRNQKDIYCRWYNMIYRIYGDKSSQPELKENITVDERWFNFQTYCEWFLNKSKGMNQKGLKIYRQFGKGDYSPDNCFLGYEADDPTKQVLKTYKFKYRDAVITITGLKDFCKTHGLNYGCMINLNSGTYNGKSYKGFSQYK